ncbi:copper chaperone PCu(A)C [Aliihoeflea sp. 2WW]|uniref:copper chaperone PCu(A)C n=1 Tax=Aliihoeflea sp. 2WW TaxID=1381123 RepID=UPI0004A313DD|nr:copper chaperone PCu(A)C [Aliihoeflea sp. 2WW]
MKFIRYIALAGALLAAPAFAHDFAAGDLTIDHPWSRATPKGARVAAGYASITNNGSEADRLIEVRSDFAASAEIHEMAVDGNGVMTMRPLADGIEIPAGEEVKLEPGSFHIMFMGPEKQLVEGENFAGTLVFEKAGEVEVEFAVEGMGGPGGHAGHNH